MHYDSYPFNKVLFEIISTINSFKRNEIITSQGGKDQTIYFFPFAFPFLSGLAYFAASASRKLSDS